MQYLITSRSLTQAQKAAKILEKHGITATVVKAPQGLSTRGCAYAVSIYRRFNEAVEILKKNNLLTGKLFVKTEQGEFKEV